VPQTWVPGLIGGYLKVPNPDRGGIMPLYVTTEVIKRTTKRISGKFKLSTDDKKTAWIRWRITRGGVIECYGGDPRMYVIVQTRIDAVVGHWESENE
jgi:hypothetical protein